MWNVELAIPHGIFIIQYGKALDVQPHELTWNYLDSRYQTSVAQQYARYALALEYDSLPDAVVHQAKRSLLDTIGCAIGAYDTPGRVSCEELVRDVGGTQEATVFGSGIRTNAHNAAFVNSFLVRHLDYNDSGGGGHQSDGIPSVLAVAERESSNGKDFLTSVVVSYELGARFREAVRNASNGEFITKKGWTSDVRGGLNMPPALGKLMGLTESEIANAIGCCASRNLPLKILDADREELTMSKNLRFGSVASDAIFSCILAKNGFTGPVRIVEGDGGLREVVLHGELDEESLLDFNGWRTLETDQKKICASSSLQPLIYPTLSIVEANDLDPEDIESVHIRCSGRGISHYTSLSRKYPRNGETASHSAYYAIAKAIKDHEFGPEAITDLEISNPIVLDLIERITIERDPDLPERSLKGSSEVTTKDGERYREQIEQLPGYGDRLSDEAEVVSDPSRLTDAELEEKFRSMAGKQMDDEQIQTIFDMVWNLEDLDDMGELAESITFA